MPVSIVFHGHSNLEIHSADHRIQIDPFYTGNPSADSIDPVNPTFILITHAHGDHVGDAVALSKKSKAPIVANYEMCLYLQKHGAADIRPMNHGGTLALPFGRVFMTIAFHTSTFDDGTTGGQPAGFIVETGGKTIYHAGDTGLFGDMKLLGELFNIDLACLPIGDGFTMGPAHAVKAAQMLRQKVLPIHYNTYPPIQQDAAKFVADLKAVGIEGLPMKAGQTVEL